jgi:tRNA pseudouridine38-40 synthase
VNLPSEAVPKETDPNRRRFALRIHYDGSPFHGWQLQPGMPTVQGALEAVLTQIAAGRRVAVIGSGRTDRGVHATGQIAVADLPEPWTSAPLRRSLNAMLPDGIWVEAVRRVPPRFHPRFDAVRRRYRYRVGTAPRVHSPFLAQMCWPRTEGALDLTRLNACAALLPGTRSFRPFAKAGQPERGEICTIFEAKWEPWGTLGFTFEVEADRFLHHMVRYLVGTMVQVAAGERPLSAFEALLTDPDTSLVTSPPAPSEGLFLVNVEYPEGAWGEHPDMDPVPEPATPSPTLQTPPWAEAHEDLP